MSGGDIVSLWRGAERNRESFQESVSSIDELLDKVEKAALIDDATYRDNYIRGCIKEIATNTINLETYFDYLFNILSDALDALEK